MFNRFPSEKSQKSMVCQTLQAISWSRSVGSTLNFAWRHLARDLKERGHKIEKGPKIPFFDTFLILPCPNSLERPVIGENQ